MKTTIRDEKEYYLQKGFLTRKQAAEILYLEDGSNIDKIMQGYPVLMMHRNDGKIARMYHHIDVRLVRDRRAEQNERRNRAKHAPELFDKRTIKATAKSGKGGAA